MKLVRHWPPSPSSAGPTVGRLRGPERWSCWKALLDAGVYGTKAELARGEGVSRAAVTQGLGKLEGR